MNEFWKRIFRKTSLSCQWKSRLLNQERYRFLGKDELGFSLNIGLLNKPDYFGLINLQIEDARIMKGCLFLKLTSIENTLKFTIGVDLVNSRLQYNPYKGPEIRGNGSVDASRCILGFYKFSRALFLNGQLKIEEAQSRKVLGFKNAFIPVDVNVKGTIDSIDRSIAVLNMNISTRSSNQSPIN